VSKLPWVKLFVNDWRAGTHGLTPEARIVYWEVLLLMYDDPTGTCSDNIDRIAVGTALPQRLVKYGLSVLIACGKIVPKDGRLTCPKVDSLIRDRDARSEAGRERVARRWNMNELRHGKPSRAGHKVQTKSPSDNKAALIQEPYEVEEEVEVEEEKGCAIIQSSTSGTVAPVANAPVPTKRSSMVPVGWAPSVQLVEYAKTLGLTEHEALEQGQAMVDWASANGKRKLDWDATFRTWCRTTMQRRGQYKRPGERHGETKSLAQLSHELPIGFGGRKNDTGRNH
jgi:hypothetical protein